MSDVNHAEFSRMMQAATYVSEFDCIRRWIAVDKPDALAKCRKELAKIRDRYQRDGYYF